MDSIIQSLARLAEVIANDRDIYINNNSVLSSTLDVGEGLIETGNTSQEDNIDDVKDEVHMEDQSSLFVDIDDNPAELDDEIEEDEILEWLNELGDQITSLNAITSTTPCPRLAVVPQPHQQIALAKIEHVRHGLLKTILIGDPPGLGKTFPAMMAAVKAKFEAENQLPSIVVTPSSCVPQWRSEFAKFFLPDTVRVFVIRDPNTSPLELLKYDVILTSYSFIMSQYRKLRNYISNVAQYKEDVELKTPIERPSLSLFSEIFYSAEGKKFPYIVLDEVTAIKNSGSMTFAATQELRELADTCIMLSGSPVDNTWFDAYAYILLVKSHSITTRPTMISLFASRNAKGKIVAPRDMRFCRLVQLLNSFVVRRPECTIQLPELERKDVFFTLSVGEADRSNTEFDKYLQIINMKSSGSPEFEQLQPWKYLTHASQHACHPAMVQIMEFARNPLEVEHVDDAAQDVLYEASDIERWIEWREELTKDDNWKSSRILALIDLFNKQRDIDPTCSVLIFDESVYFLDIVQIAFTQMYDAVECLRYDGREPPERRIATLQDFKRAAGAKVLLISRAAGGVGLNITAANVVILCSPWWKVEWEVQAVKRAHRTGQTRKVSAFRMIASNGEVEKWKANTRDKKNKHNSKIVCQITRRDGAMPKVWDDLI